jgi:hypothetical protein
VASVGGKAGELRFCGECRDILSGEVYEGSVKLEPYELRIVRKA